MRGNAGELIATLAHIANMTSRPGKRDRSSHEKTPKNNRCFGLPSSGGAISVNGKGRIATCKALASSRLRNKLEHPWFGGENKRRRHRNHWEIACNGVILDIMPKDAEDYKNYRSLEHSTLRKLAGVKVRAFQSPNLKGRNLLAMTNDPIRLFWS
jgi:hypothetical protein